MGELKKKSYKHIYTKKNHAPDCGRKQNSRTFNDPKLKSLIYEKKNPLRKLKLSSPKIVAVDDFCKKITCTQIKGVSCQHEKKCQQCFLAVKVLGQFKFLFHSAGIFWGVLLKVAKARYKQGLSKKKILTEAMYMNNL